MDLKTITAVREAIKGEALTDDVKAKLSEIEAYYKNMSAKTSEYEDLQSKFSEVETDLMMEKGKRKKAETRIDEWKETAEDNDKKLKGFENLGVEVETLKTENETLKTYKVERDTTIRSDYQKRIDEYSKKEAFEKVKGKIVMPSDEKKMEDLTIEEIASSNKELDMARDYGLFGASGSQTPPGAGQEEETEGSVMAQLDAMNIPRPNK